ncbi:MAG: M23 family metallopeptidase [Cytophagales bacterium]|nr:M23 family metallopeptidase [Cytophagales bacterium]
MKKRSEKGKWWRRRFFFLLREEQSLSETRLLRISVRGIFLWVGVSMLVVLSSSLFFTGYLSRSYLEKKYARGTLNQRMLAFASVTDSLSRQVQMYSRYVKRVQALLGPDTLNPQEGISFSEIVLGGEKKQSQTREIVHFLAPIADGYVTDGFDLKKWHHGVDVVSRAEELVRAMADGTVLFSTWTRDGGYVLGLQHAGDYFSVYKHNSDLLRDVGVRVKAGEPIARMGNTGDLSSGPHLHVELWYRGHPLDIQKFVRFR